MVTSNAKKSLTGPSHVDRSTVAGQMNESGVGLAADQRHQMIAEAAFFLAAARGFAPNCELGDWLAAEAAIDLQRSNIIEAPKKRVSPGISVSQDVARGRANRTTSTRAGIDDRKSNSRSRP